MPGKRTSRRKLGKPAPVKKKSSAHKVRKLRKVGPAKTYLTEPHPEVDKHGSQE